MSEVIWAIILLCWGLLAYIGVSGWENYTKRIDFGDNPEADP